MVKRLKEGRGGSPQAPPLSLTLEGTPNPHMIISQQVNKFTVAHTRLGHSLLEVSDLPGG